MTHTLSGHRPTDPRPTRFWASGEMERPPMMLGFIMTTLLVAFAFSVVAWLFAFDSFLCTEHDRHGGQYVALATGLGVAVSAAGCVASILTRNRPWLMWLTVTFVWLTLLMGIVLIAVHPVGRAVQDCPIDLSSAHTRHFHFWWVCAGWAAIVVALFFQARGIERWYSASRHVTRCSSRSR